MQHQNACILAYCVIKLKNYVDIYVCVSIDLGKVFSDLYFLPFLKAENLYERVWLSFSHLPTYLFSYIKKIQNNVVFFAHLLSFLVCIAGFLSDFLLQQQH